MTITATHHSTLNEEVLIGRSTTYHQLIRALEFLGERSRNIAAVAKHLGVVERSAHYYMNTLGYLGLAEYTEIGNIQEHYLTAAGMELLAEHGERREEMFADLLTPIPAFYLCLVDGADVATEFFVKRYGVSAATARGCTETVKMLLKYADHEAIRGFGHPEIHDAQYMNLYVSHHRALCGSTESVDVLCSSCFLALPATGVCGYCD